MSYEVLISNEAEKYYDKQDKKSKQRINEAIDTISRDPLTGGHIKKLWGEHEGKHRFALGSLRIVYKVDKRNKIVRVLAIRGRGDIYKSA